MSRTVSARIPNELHDELRERCNKVGCTMTEWIEHAIEFCMTDHTEFDFGDEEESNKIKQVSKPEKAQDPNEGKRPVIHLYEKDGKLVQGETTWEEK